MTLRSYMDYHLSCYVYISRQEYDQEVDEMDLFEAWELAVKDWRADTQAMARDYKSETLHFDSFRDSGSAPLPAPRRGLTPTHYPAPRRGLTPTHHHSHP